MADNVDNGTGLRFKGSFAIAQCFFMVELDAEIL